MSALRLMTFNVQILPLVALKVQGQSDDAVERADRVADAILSFPVAERPDVIAFNEAFNEDGRYRLKDRLSSWPNMVVRIDNGGIDNNSGLMLVSRLPFHNLPTGGVLYEHFYNDGEGTDALACKAVGIIQTNRPAEITTIAFTHLQASYATEDEYREVRAKQLQEVFNALSAVLGPDSSEWRNVILVGDLNIRGDSGAETDEWSKTFKSGSPFGTAFSDGWRSLMHPPGIDSDLDRGFTNIDLGSGKLQRLDYHCFSGAGVPATGAVAHHMFVRLRDQSDHFALEAVIERWSRHCTPIDAIELESIAPFTSSTGDPTSLRMVDVAFLELDAYQWIYVKKPGTYTVHKPPALTTRLFLETDLSNAISPVDTLAISDLPPGAQAGFEEVSVDPKGTTFAARRPFFIAVQTTANGPDHAKLSVFEHVGDTPARAIWLTPHISTPSSFPIGQPLGIYDLCWFKVQLPLSFGGLQRTEKFTFSNNTGTWIDVYEFDTAAALEFEQHAQLHPLDSVSGTQTSLDLNIDTTGGEQRLFAIRRSSTKEVGYTCFWFSPISYLALDRPFGFYVSDESGPDWAGDDEIDLDILVDGSSLFSGSWDSADTGERWPGLVEAIRNRLASVLPGMRRLPFINNISLSYIENDISAAGRLVESIEPLLPSDPGSVNRRLNLPIPDSISDGRYTFYCSISRFAE
jgi:Endonuclease/Exonuclease/phosphatase family